MIVKAAATESRDAYADFAPSTVKSIQRLDGLPTAIALARTIGFNPVMTHRLYNHPMSSGNGSDVSQPLVYNTLTLHFSAHL